MSSPEFYAATAHGPEDTAAHTVTRWRTLWISALQLGSPGCHAESLLDFLRRNETQTLYLLGNLVGSQSPAAPWHWPRAHNDVVQHVLRLARHGTRVYLIPARSDTAVRRFLGQAFGDIEVHDEHEHLTMDQRRLLVTHHDDSLLIPALPAALDQPLRRAVETLQRLWRRYRSTQNPLDTTPLAQTLQRRGLHGIICSHTAAAATPSVAGLQYCHAGDWSRHRSVLSEDHDGLFRLLDWSAQAPTPRATGFTHHPLSLPALPSTLSRRVAPRTPLSGKTR